MGQVIQFPNAELTEVMTLIWPDKVSLLRNEIDRTKNYIKAIADDSTYTKQEKQSWDHFLEGLEMAMSIMGA